MTSRQRGPSTGTGRGPNLPYPYNRRGSTDDREAPYNDQNGDRAYLSPKVGPRDADFDTSDISMPVQFGYRPRAESNLSILSDSGRYPRPQVLANPDETRARGGSMGSSPNRAYREDSRPRSGQSNGTPTSRDKPHYGTNDYQPPHFPQNPYVGTRLSETAENQDNAGRRSRPNSRTQSPIPPYPVTPTSSQYPRYENTPPDQSRGRGNTNTKQLVIDSNIAENPFQLAPLKFSPPRNEDSYSLLAGTQFDDFAASKENEAPKTSPPQPLRPPPPPPPSRHGAQSPRHARVPQFVSPSTGPESTDRTNTGEEWSLDNVIDFLRQNGFGEQWQQAFRDADIHGDKFRACASFPEAKKLVHVPHEAQQPQSGRTLFKLITLIRKVLNPDSDTPDSETSTPTPRNQERPVEPEKLLRSQTAPPSSTSGPPPESPGLPPPPNSAKHLPRLQSEQQVIYGPPPGRHDPPTPKLQPPPPPRTRSPQDAKRPLSPNVVDARHQLQYSANQTLSPFRHSKNYSNESNLSDQSGRSANPPSRSSQDFQEMLGRISKDGTIAPQRRIDKKKSHEQMSKPGIIKRFFGGRDKTKEVQPDSDEQDVERGPMTPPLPPQPPYNNPKVSNNSQSSLDSSSISTPIDEVRPPSLTTSISSLPSIRPPSDLSVPQYTVPPVLWVQVTQDEDNFKRCDLSHIGPDPVVIREKLCQKFGLKSKETALYITDILGIAEDAEELDDDALLNACSRGDGRGTLKFLLKSVPRKSTSSPGKLTIPPVPQSLRPAQGMLSVPDASKDGRDLRSTSISEDPNRKGHYNTTPMEMYGGGYAKVEGEDVTKTGPMDYFNRVEDVESSGSPRLDSASPMKMDDVSTRIFEAADKAKKNREGRKRTESGGSDKITPLEESSFGFRDPSVSPGGRRRPGGQDDPGFEKILGFKVEPPNRQQPKRQQSLPLSPNSAGSFRVISKEQSSNVLDFSKPRASPYSTFFGETPAAPQKQQPSQQLPSRTPSGIKAQRRAPAPPQFPLLPSRTATVVATQKYPEKAFGRGSQNRRLSDSQNLFTRRSTEDERFAAQRNGGMSPDLSRPARGSAIADLVSKSTFAGGFIPMSSPSIVTPGRGSNLEPTGVPKRAPSPGTPGARLGITVNTNLANTGDESPPTEWQSSVSPYSGLKISPAPTTEITKLPKTKESSDNVETTTTDIRFKESTSITFDDAPEFDLPDDDDDESLWAVKPIGVDDRPNTSRKSSEEKGSPLLRKKSSLRQKGRSGNRPPLTVQIDDKVIEIPTPQFSAIAEEFPSISSSSHPSESSGSLSSGLIPEHRAESPEYTIGDDRKGLNSPMRIPPSPVTPVSATASSGSAATAASSTTDLSRKNSFAKHEDVWAVRPPPDVVFNNLEEFFPNHDLDKPILVDSGHLSPPVSPADGSDSDNNATVKPQTPHKSEKPENQEKTEKPPLQSVTSAPIAAFPKPAARMKSIRVVAKEAIEKRTRLASIAKGIKGANLLRRKSTKVWGARMLEMTPGQVRLGQIVSTDNEDGLERKRTFKWVKGELIGKGTYGSVYLGLNATTGEMLAVKQVEVSKSISDRDEDRSKPMMDALNAEIETLKDLDHPHIVQYLGYERTEKTISIFLEYVPGGSVGRCLKKHGRFEEKVIRSLIRQTLDGLAYLHAQGRLHRDVKADNLLLDLDGVCKISDFGISKQSKDVYANEHNTLAGTIFWMAPEVIQSRKEGYSAKIDIWSLGCVVLEMFAGKRPWSTEEAIGAMFKLGNERKAPPIPEDVKDYMSPEAKDFLDKCFTIEAAERPTAAMLLDHPFCAYDPNFRFLDSKLGKAVRFGQNQK